jgi:hypothetical protein
MFVEESNWGEIDQAAAVNLGKAEWLRSFEQQHLDRCSHYRIMFYDALLDVICEDISAGRGPYSQTG